WLGIHVHTRTATQDLNIVDIRLEDGTPMIVLRLMRDATARAISPGGGPLRSPRRAVASTCSRPSIACHTIGRGDRIGPDLAGLSRVREGDGWLAMSRRRM